MSAAADPEKAKEKAKEPDSDSDDEGGYRGNEVMMLLSSARGQVLSANVSTDEWVASTTLRCEAARLLPGAEVDYVRTHGPRILGRSDVVIRSEIAARRLATPVCNFCGRSDGKLFSYRLCLNCCSTWYCTSSNCRELDGRDHVAWCGRPGASRDLGVLRSRLE